MAQPRHLTRYWTLKMQQKFIDRFTQLLEHGFSISEGLNVMSTLFQKDQIQTLITSCQMGFPFADTLEASGFEHRTIYIIRCNEESGSLLQGLQKARIYCQHHLQNQQEFKKKLRYPLFLFLLMLSILVAVYLFFIPQVDSFYQTFNIDTNQFYFDRIIYLIGGTIGFILLILSFILLILKFDYFPFQQKMKDLFFQCFGFRLLSQKLFTYYFSLQWLMHLESGIDLKESLKTIKSFEKIPMIKVIITEMEEYLEQGESLDSFFHSTPYFTPYFELIISHALTIGCVEEELKHFTKDELTHLTNLINLSLKIVQTFFLMLVGILIVLLYLSILQPVFEMVQFL